MPEKFFCPICKTGENIRKMTAITIGLPAESESKIGSESLTYPAQVNLPFVYCAKCGLVFCNEERRKEKEGTIFFQ